LPAAQKKRNEFKTGTEEADTREGKNDQSRCCASCNSKVRATQLGTEERVEER
jgi:hypothetical protein